MMALVVVRSETGAVLVVRESVASAFGFTQGDDPVTDDVLAQMRKKQWESNKQEAATPCSGETVLVTAWLSEPM
jgi:hypothetical protein